MNKLGAFVTILFLSLNLSFLATAQLKQNYYANICPSVETIVRNVVRQKIQQTFVTIPATLRLFFHDCFVEGCDASVIVASSGSNIAEKDHDDNMSLAGDGFDTVIRAKAAVDADPSCANKVSCADILAIATRDVIDLAGGPKYKVELGRLDGLSSTSSSVDGKLPHPNFDLNQLNAIFAANGLNQTEMIALSAAHTLGFSHCSKFSDRIYNFNATTQVDPTLNATYASQLQSMCPQDVDPRIAIDMDPITPQKFDNAYYKNLVNHMGLFSSDQVLFTDSRSQSIVSTWATNSAAFNKTFVSAITKLGRVGVKTELNGNIRRDCASFN